MSRAIAVTACAWFVCAALATEAELKPKLVTFPAYDDYVLSADYYEPANTRKAAPVVILLHDCGGDRTDWRPLVAPLHQAGFAVLALDLRGHGHSATSETRERVQQRDPYLFEDMFNDLRGAYDWLAEQPEIDRARLALVGAGTGSGVALRYSRKDRSVDAIVCLSPSLYELDLDSKADLRDQRGRHVLLLGARQDRETCKVLAAATEGTDKHVYSSESRGTDLLEAEDDLPLRITRFLTDALGRPTRNHVFGSIHGKVYHFPDARWVQIIKPSNLREYSSPEEATSRGLRESKTKGPLRNRP